MTECGGGIVRALVVLGAGSGAVGDWNKIDRHVFGSAEIAARSIDPHKFLGAGGCRNKDRATASIWRVYTWTEIETGG